ncbi:hypothetical protein PFISCL1PPCAC_1803, partial [Pristionchus fissidentatus]
SKRENNHFWLSWTTEGCGGQLLRQGKIAANVTDHILKLGDDDLVECQWTISAPAGKRVQTNVSTLLSYAMNCEEYGDKFTGLAIFDDSTNSSGIPIKTQCAKIDTTFHSPVLSLASHGGEMFIHIRVKKSQLPQSISSSFFVATVEFIDMPEGDAQCGGIVHVSPVGSPSV